MQKVCTQCGESLPETAFRKYGQGRKGLYKRCKTCESLNNRYKYLIKKQELSEKEASELNTIESAYKDLMSLGHNVPSYSNTAMETKASNYAQLIDDIKSRVISKYNLQDTFIPDELMSWLTRPLAGKSPEYYLYNVYDALLIEWCPVVSYDSEKQRPVRDDTYKKIMSAILERFYAYEESYVAE